MNDHDTRAIPPGRRNRITEQFIAHRISMLELPAYRALSRAAFMVISRIAVEHAHHGGNDNGRLPVTTDQFVAYARWHRASGRRRRWASSRSPSVAEAAMPSTGGPTCSF